MKLRHTPSFGEAYPSLLEGPLLTHEDIQDTARFLRENAPEIAGSFKDDFIEVELGGRSVRAVFSQGEDKGHVVLVPAEYATGRGKMDDRDAVMRAYAIRYMVNPNASLLYVPNNVFGENNLNLSREERAIVRGTKDTPGDFRPLTDRIRVMLEDQDVKDSKLTGVGNSQGASVITSLAARGDFNMHSMSTFLPPDIKKRPKDELIKDFLSGGKNLFTNIEISKLGTESDFLSQNPLDLLKFAVNAVGLNNRATMGPVMAGRHEENVRQALALNPGLVVVRGWVPHAAISPAKANAEAGKRLFEEFDGRVENHKIPGDLADETSPNVFLISGSLGRRAYALANAA